MPRYRGRHRKPSTAAETAVRVGTVAVLSPVGVTLVTPTAIADAAESPNWEAVVRCESGGQNIHTRIEPHKNTASGYFQITNGTWRAYGGTEFARTAMGASRAEQQTVADRIYADSGLSPWKSSRDCWQGKTKTAPPAPSAPSSAPRHRDDGGQYTVRPGDTMVKIAAEHDISLTKLVKQNRHTVSNPRLIHVGQILTV